MTDSEFTDELDKARSVLEQSALELCSQIAILKQQISDATLLNGQCSVAGQRVQLRSLEAELRGVQATLSIVAGPKITG